VHAADLRQVAKRGRGSIRGCEPKGAGGRRFPDDWIPRDALRLCPITSGKLSGGVENCRCGNSETRPSGQFDDPFFFVRRKNTGPPALRSIWRIAADYSRRESGCRKKWELSLVICFSGSMAAHARSGL